ncbi:nucleotide sugar dehydrogenase [Clostridium cellulovorans]|uniref:Nucleotide sugar dehydrogenase n=1 Tax=Clostridium cellulovorans (strain ATCC 35296 / DSM 3052 / OCM 3 / 743B) TaxID=573061 RepID=D9SU73_CLOC7|nr:nucleotide sugar dehydrogenase [Clostridium cellulovorans]ADL52828.1 nucleotide sugar dehydrogenase [Clostridium cellulovorans 743B]
MEEFYEKLNQEIISKKSIIGVIGLGYVGLPIVESFVKSGFQTIGFDIDDEKIKKLIQNESYITDFTDKDIEKINEFNRFYPTNKFDKISQCDVLIICVPTPLKEDKLTPDLTFLNNSLKSIGENIRRGTLVVLESTTYPFTTSEVVVPYLEKLGLKVGDDVFVAFSPERINPGVEKFKFSSTPKIVGGKTERCKQIATALYGCVIDKVVPVSKPEVAEMAKLLENTYRYINIALVNEIETFCSEMDIDIYEVIEAASTKPFGFEKFYPGPGVGGHCIPIDPFYYKWYANEKNFETLLIDAAFEINANRPKNVFNKAMMRMKGVKNSIITVLGVAYKKNINDLRESSAIELIEMLINNGYEVRFSDAFCNKILIKADGKSCEMLSVDFNEELLEKSGLIIIHTDHDYFNYELLNKYKEKIIDTRYALSKFENEDRLVYKDIVCKDKDVYFERQI